MAHNNITSSGKMQEINITINRELSTFDLLEQQKEIITALIKYPSFLDKYIHYRGSETVQFQRGLTDIPKVPFISYNNEKICCIIDKINDISDGVDSCGFFNIMALGTRGNIGVPYIVKGYDNAEMIVKVNKIDKLYSKYRANPPSSLSKIASTDILTINSSNMTEINSEKFFEINQCITNVGLSRMRYIASDEFTNETLIAYVLNFLADKLSLPPLYVKHYQGAICSNPKTKETFGLNMMEYCDLGSLNKLPEHLNFLKYNKKHSIDDNGKNLEHDLLDDDVILDILTQITVGLHMLQKYAGFVSGDLKSENIFVKSDPIDTTYMGIKIKSAFTCKISDYGKSSCMVPGLNSLRFYNENALANVYLKFHPFAPEISKNQTNKMEGEYYYTIGDISVNRLYTRIRHMGIPFYRSFDYYTVLVSTLTNPAFFYMFFSDDKLRRIFWNPIWIDNVDANEALSRIRQYVLLGTGQRLRDTINILRGLKLKCRAVNLVIKKLQILNLN